MLNVMNIVKRAVKTIIHEIIYGVLYALVSNGKEILRTIVTEAASNSEIERLSGRSSLAFTEFLMRYNNSFNPVFIGLELILIVLMLYEVYKFIYSVYKEIFS